MRYFFVSFLSITFCMATSISNAENMGDVITNNIDKTQAGHVALVDITKKRLVQIDSKGKVVWSTKIPEEFSKANLNAATDIEWLSPTDTFLVGVPDTGFFEINRKGETLKVCKNKHISHDVDKLKDGSFIFINGWDDKGKDEPILTKVSASCKVEWIKKRAFFGVDEADLQPRYADDKAVLHSNSVRILSDDQIMVSIRNYDQVVVIKDDRIIKRFKNAPGVHDPSKVYTDKDGDFFYYLNRGRPNKINKRNFNSPETKSTTVWEGPRSRKRAWNPLRTLEKLKNGNWLVTGSREIGQVSADGELVWEMYFPKFRHQRGKNKNITFIYKVAFIEK